MTRQFSKRIATALLAIFLVNICIWNFQSHWPAHEIEHKIKHGTGLISMTAVDDYVDAQVSKAADGSDHERINSVGHQLLHTIDQLELFVSESVVPHLYFVPGKLSYHFRPITVPHAIFEAPFRPPRFISPSI